jgi:hypothetical protein
MSGLLGKAGIMRGMGMMKNVGGWEVKILKIENRKPVC